MIPVNNARSRNGHDDVICIDVVAARTLSQNDAGAVVGRDVAVSILCNVFYQVTDRHGQVGVAAVELFELSENCARFETFFQQKHRLGESLSPWH